MVVKSAKKCEKWGIVTTVLGIDDNFKNIKTCAIIPQSFFCSDIDYKMFTVFEKNSKWLPISEFNHILNTLIGKALSLKK